MKPFTTLAIIIFALIALAHLYRLSGTSRSWCTAWSCRNGSARRLVVAGGLALMLWRESRRYGQNRGQLLFFQRVAVTISVPP